MPRVSNRSYASRYSRGSRRQLQWKERALVRGATIAAARAIPSRGLPGTGVEFKSVDVAANVDAHSVATLTLLNGIARGADIDERDGREVVMRSIQLSYTAQVTSGTGTAQRVRVMVVYDRQTNGAAPTSAQIMSVDSDVHAPRNLEYRKRFTILHDRVYVLNAHNESGGEQFCRFYRKLNHPITFNSGNAGTVADIATGSLYLVCCGTQDSGESDGVVIFNSRVRYTEQ